MENLEQHHQAPLEANKAPDQSIRDSEKTEQLFSEMKKTLDWISQSLDILIQRTK